MVKHLALLIAISALSVAMLTYFGTALQGLEHTHALLAHKLTAVFAGGKIGQFIRDTVLLIALPIAIALVPGGIYWAIRRQQLPSLTSVVWVIWLVLVTTLAMHPHVISSSVS